MCGYVLSNLHCKLNFVSIEGFHLTKHCAYVISIAEKRKLFIVLSQNTKTPMIAILRILRKVLYVHAGSWTMACCVV